MPGKPALNAGYLPLPPACLCLHLPAPLGQLSMGHEARPFAFCTRHAFLGTFAVMLLPASTAAALQLQTVRNFVIWRGSLFARRHCANAKAIVGVCSRCVCVCVGASVCVNNWQHLCWAHTEGGSGRRGRLRELRGRQQGIERAVERAHEEGEGEGKRWTERGR